MGHLCPITSHEAQEILCKRDCKRQRWQMTTSKQYFLEICTFKLTMIVIECTRPTKTQTRQNVSMDSIGEYKIPSPPKGLLGMDRCWNGEESTFCKCVTFGRQVILWQQATHPQVYGQHQSFLMGLAKKEKRKKLTQSWVNKEDGWIQEELG